MKVIAGILLFSIPFFSCLEKEKKKDILPESEMRELIWDMMRADQYVAAFLSKDSARNKKDESIKLYEEIFHIHKITREQFQASFDYYSSQPDLFRPIIDSLANRRTTSDQLRPNPIRPGRKDSLMKPLLRKRQK